MRHAPRPKLEDKKKLERRLRQSNKLREKPKLKLKLKPRLLLLKLPLRLLLKSKRFRTLSKPNLHSSLRRRLRLKRKPKKSPSLRTRLSLKPKPKLVEEPRILPRLEPRLTLRRPTRLKPRPTRLKPRPMLGLDPRADISSSPETVLILELDKLPLKLDKLPLKLDKLPLPDSVQPQLVEADTLPDRVATEVSLLSTSIVQNPMELLLSHLTKISDVNRLHVHLNVIQDIVQYNITKLSFLKIKIIKITSMKFKFNRRLYPIL